MSGLAFVVERRDVESSYSRDVTWAVTSSSGVDLATEPCYGGYSRGWAAVTGRLGSADCNPGALSQTCLSLFFSCARFLRRSSILTQGYAARPSVVCGAREVL